MSNRDDFTKATKDLVAQRVAYRCSFKDCGVATIGPQYGDTTKSNNMGIACHICAASPGGPRYDPKMTREERKSPENCIWMCPTHAEIIDHDPNKYPKELLHEWKKEAEAKAESNLVNYNFSKNQLDNGKELEKLFDGLIEDGNYDTLRMLIDKVKCSNVHSELLLRYEIIYNIYCNRHALHYSIDYYIDNVFEKQSDAIVEVLVASCINTGLNKLTKFCVDQEIIKLANKLLDGTIYGFLFRNKTDIDNSKEEITLKDDKGILFRLISNIIINNKYPVLPIMIDGNEFQFYDKEFAYKMMAYAWQLFNHILQSQTLNEEKATKESYILIKTSLHKIVQLDKSIQQFIWEAVLDYVINDKVEFNMLYDVCPLLIKESKELKRIKAIFDLIHNEADVEKMLYDNTIKDDDKILIPVLQSLPKDKRLEFLEDNRYLFKRSSVYIYLWCIVSAIGNEDKAKMILIYEEYFKDDFLWNCLSAYYSENIIPEKLTWLKKNKQNLDAPTLSLYIKVLGKYSQWEELREVAEVSVPLFLKYQSGFELMSSRSNEDIVFCLELFKKLEEDGFYEKGFYHNYAVLYYRINDIFQSNLYFEKEYDESNDERDLLNILNARVKCSKFEIDRYVEHASKSSDSDVLCLVSYFYEKNQNYYQQKIYLLKSFIANPENENAKRGLAYMSINGKLDESDDFGRIYSLENEKHIIKIALLDNVLLNGIKQNQIMDFVLADANSNKYNSWRFYDVGEEIEYNSQNYNIKAIDSFSKVISSYAISQLMISKDVIAITGKTPEEAIKNLSEILIQREEEVKKVFSKFKKSKGFFPVTLLARQLGTTFSNVWSSLISEQEFNISNSFGTISGERTLILTNDAIITLYSLNSFDDLSNENFILPNQVKTLFLSELDDKIMDLQQKNSVGSLYSKQSQLFKVDYDRNYKKGASHYFSALHSVLSKIIGHKGQAFKSANDELTKLFVENNLVNESYTLGLAQSNRNYAIVTDEPFMCLVCELEKIPHIGAIELLLNQKLSPDKKLDYLEKLANYNFLNYFNVKVYKEIIDSILTRPQDESKRLLQRLGKWLAPGDCTLKHKQLVLNVFQELGKEDMDSVYFQFIRNIGKLYFSELFPEKYQEIIDRINNMRMEIKVLPTENDKLNFQIEFIEDDQKNDPN